MLSEGRELESSAAIGEFIEKLANPQNQFTCEGIEHILEISRQLDRLLSKYNRNPVENKVDSISVILVFVHKSFPSFIIIALAEFRIGFI